MYTVCSYDTPERTGQTGRAIYRMGIICVLQVIDKRYGQHTYLPKTMKYSRPKFYTNATLSTQVLCSKHYISMYCDEYLTKLWLSAKKKRSHKIPPPHKP